MGNFFSSQFGKRKKRKMSSEEDYSFPSTLEEFGYYFNNEGQLRNKGTNEPFVFKVKEDDHRYNQKHYEALGDIITNHIYQLMEDRYNLKRKVIPVDAEEEEATTFIYTSDDALTNPDKLLVLIHGSGAVRAGQWARRLIINDCLDSGTQFPFIEWGIQNKYGIIVANTNVNKATVNGEEVDIRCSESPEQHTECVWKEFVQKSKARHIAIVAHSYGGICTLELANKFIEDFKKRIFAVALTDSVHSFGHQESSEEVIQFYKERARNWASSYDVLDTVLESRTDYCPKVSAGTDKHEYTSFSSMHSIFKFFDEKYKENDLVHPVEEIKQVSTEQSSSTDTDTYSQSITATQPESISDTQPEEVPMSQDSQGVEMMSQDLDNSDDTETKHKEL